MMSVKKTWGDRERGEEKEAESRFLLGCYAGSESQ
jgi:hypothetical protein